MSSLFSLHSWRMKLIPRPERLRYDTAMRCMNRGCGAIVAPQERSKCPYCGYDGIVSLSGLDRIKERARQNMQEQIRLLLLQRKDAAALPVRTSSSSREQAEITRPQGVAKAGNTALEADSRNLSLVLSNIEK